MDKSKILDLFEELKELDVEFTIRHYDGGWIGTSPEELLEYYEIGNFYKYWTKKLDVDVKVLKNYETEKHYGVQCCAMTVNGGQCKNNVNIYHHNIYEYIEAKKENNFLCKTHNKLADVKYMK